jgi:cbb3-type cytochrome oxidase subunit 1
MPRIAEYFFRAAILFLIVGIGIGLMMGITQNHNVIGAHAHINLLGWVTSGLFGTYYALNPNKARRPVAMAHFLVYTAGVVTMTFSLYMVLSGEGAFDVPLIIGSLVIAVGVLLFGWVVYSPQGATRAANERTAIPAE